MLGGSDDRFNCWMHRFLTGFDVSEALSVASVWPGPRNPLVRSCLIHDLDVTKLRDSSQNPEVVIWSKNVQI